MCGERTSILEGCKTPEDGFIKLNTDEACCATKVWRYHSREEGGIKEGSIKVLGSVVIFKEEMWRALKGLRLTKKLEFLKVELCVDSKLVVKIIKSGALKDIEVCYTLVKQIQKCVELHENVRVDHLYREVNYCAGALAKTSIYSLHNKVFQENVYFIEELIDKNVKNTVSLKIVM